MVKIKQGKNRSSTGEIVLRALRNLMKNTGWTSRTIAKYIQLEYGVTDPKFGRKVSKALQRATRMGLIENSSGRYRLSHVTGMVKSRAPEKDRKRKRRARSRCHRTIRRRDRMRPLRIRSRSPSCDCCLD